MALAHMLLLTLFCVSLLIVLAFTILLIVDHVQKKRIMGAKQESASRPHSVAHR